MNRNERKKAINTMHKDYAHKIAELYEKDLMGAENIIDRTIAFLMALENVKISTIESLSAVNVKLKMEKMLETYGKSKQAAIAANREAIEAQIKSGEIPKIKWSKPDNSMYR